MNDAKLKSLLALAVPLALKEGSNSTAIPYLSIGKRQSPRALTAVTMEPSICVILQGEKTLYCDGQILTYPPGTFIASSRYTASSAAVGKASLSRPYIGLRLDFSRFELSEIMQGAGLASGSSGSNTNRSVEWIEDDLIDLFVKIIQLQSSQGDITYLSGLLRRELIYRLLTSSGGGLLANDFALSTTDEGVTRIIEWLKENFRDPVVIKTLARAHGMSVSTLHHRFKAMTGMGPIQFQKQLRLQEARRLILAAGDRITQAASRVGYNSAAQFSREYRRLFGQSPRDDRSSLT